MHNMVSLKIKIKILAKIFLKLFSRKFETKLKFWRKYFWNFQKFKRNWIWMSFNYHFFFSLCSTCECFYYSGQTYPLRPGFSLSARLIPSGQARPLRPENRKLSRCIPAGFRLSMMVWGGETSSIPMFRSRKQWLIVFASWQLAVDGRLAWGWVGWWYGKLAQVHCREQELLHLFLLRTVNLKCCDCLCRAESIEGLLQFSQNSKLWRMLRIR